MASEQGPFPLNATAPFRDGDGFVLVTAAMCGANGVTMHSGITYLCRSSTGAIKLRLPTKGYVNVVDVDGSATTNNITVVPPKGNSLMDGAVSENFAINLNFFGCLIAKQPNRRVWSVS
jgi:hypothetical protein